MPAYEFHNSYFAVGAKMLLTSFAAPFPGLRECQTGGGGIQLGWDRLLLLRKMVKEWYAVAAAFYDQVWRAGGKQGDEGLVWNGMTMRRKEKRRS